MKKTALALGLEILSKRSSQIALWLATLIVSLLTVLHGGDAEQKAELVGTLSPFLLAALLQVLAAVRGKFVGAVQSDLDLKPDAMPLTVTNGAWGRVRQRVLGIVDTSDLDDRI